MHRRAVLGLFSAAIPIATAGCQGLLRDRGTDQTESEQADRGEGEQNDRVAREQVETSVEGTWPTEHHDARNTRQVDVTGPRSKPEVAWERETVLGSSGDPLVVDSVLIDQDPDEEFAGSTSGTIITRGVGSGDRVATTLDGTTGLPSGLSASTAYVQHRDDGQRTASAISLESGKERWRRAIDHGDVVRSAVADDAVFAMTWFEPAVIALDDAGGSVRWQFDLPAAGSGFGVAERTVAAVLEEHLIGIDRDTGERRWITRLDSEIETAPLVADGRILVGAEGGAVVAFDEDGERLWQTSVSEDPIGTLALGSGTAWVDASPVTELDLETGARLRSLDGVSAQRLTIADQSLYALGHTDLEAVDPGTGESLWTMSFDASISRGPTVVDGRVILSTGGRDEPQTVRVLREP
jgi:outer membrane protein assembly factor BamB